MSNFTQFDAARSSLFTAIFLASDNDQETREVLENRFGPAFKALIADEAGPAAYSQYRRRLPSAGGDHNRVLVRPWNHRPAEAAFAAAETAWRLQRSL